MDNFLDIVGRELNKDKIPLPSNIRYTYRYKENESSFASLWFRTRGCSYARNGGCTMCDYFICEIVDEEEVYNSFLEGFNQITKEPDLMVIMTSGSFFDPAEVSPKVRERIYKKLSELKKTVIVFESHVTTINENVIDECLKYFPTERVYVEIGLETANEWVRNYCVNKHVTNEQVIEVFRMLNEKKIQTIVNLIIGLPFLTPKESVEDVIASVKWVIKNGGGKCSIFPVNLKPYTLVQWLYEHERYEQLPLWALCDVLSGIRSIFLPRVDINWYKRKPPLLNPLYDKPIVGAYTCDECYDTVVEQLDNYFLGDIDRKAIVENINKINCECRDVFIQNYLYDDNEKIEDRIKENYLFIARELFGEEWCEVHLEYFDIQPYSKVY